MNESTDKHVMKAIEDVMTRNVRAAISHGNETRKIVDGAIERVDKLAAQVRQLNEAIEDIRRRMALVQADLYRGGTHGNLD